MRPDQATGRQRDDAAQQRGSGAAMSRRNAPAPPSPAPRRARVPAVRPRPEAIDPHADSISIKIISTTGIHWGCGGRKLRAGGRDVGEGRTLDRQARRPVRRTPKRALSLGRVTSLGRLAAEAVTHVRTHSEALCRSGSWRGHEARPSGHRLSGLDAPWKSSERSRLAPALQQRLASPAPPARCGQASTWSRSRDVHDAHQPEE